MITCPGCGGGLKFNIKFQQMVCDYCNVSYDPYAFDQKTSDAEENTYFDTTIYTCPQCGGELLGTDNAAASFCSFCGSSTILYSRISKSKRPRYIIPFKKSKEDCKTAYSARVKKALFLPKELKKAEYIDGFRGIYMPYWSVKEVQKGPIVIKAKTSERHGDYIITKHYSISGEIDASYDGISHDASSSFYDNISERLAPYDIKERADFTPGFLSGFYADTADVDSNAYIPESTDFAVSSSYRSLIKHPEFKHYDIESDSVNKDSLHSYVESVSATMYPVWFMSYRNKDRVAYATVNGQTGKVVADLPIAPFKYLVGSFIIAAILFALFNFGMVITPKASMITCGVISFISLITSLVMGSSIKKQENIENDIGYRFRRSNSTKVDVSRIKSKKSSKIGYFTCLIACLIVFTIMLINPVYDYYYYGACIVCSVCIAISMIGLIKDYNILSTRKLPQFDRQGGDDRA